MESRQSCQKKSCRERARPCQLRIVWSFGRLCRRKNEFAKSALTHAKGDGGHDNLQHPAAPLVLNLDALLGGHARMIVASSNLALILRAHAFWSLAMLFVL